jgi:hypothetical protein
MRVMTRKDYVKLARLMGDGLAISLLAGGETARTEFYNEVYTSLVLTLAEDNDRFDTTRFSYATATAEQDYLAAAKECGREVQ